MKGRGSGGSGASRKERVAHIIRDTLTEMIASDVKDPRVHAPTMLTISRVELNVDISVARCYVSIVGDDATADAALVGLAKAASFLRGPLGRRLGLQHAPELRFLLDPTVDVSAKLAAIVREDEEKARAAGREVGSAQPSATETGGTPAQPSATESGGTRAQPSATESGGPATKEGDA